MNEAEDRIKKAIEADKKNGTMWSLSRDYALYADLFKHKGDIRDSLKDACEKAGIIYGRFKKDGFIFHDLRHTFNTNMRKAGVAESVIMEITGHSSRSMFDRYNTIDEDDTRKAIDQLENHFSNVYQTVYQKQDNKNKFNNDTV
jgi:integrase